MTDTSKEAVDLLAMVLRQRAPNNSGFDQERASNVMCALRAELDAMTAYALAATKAITGLTPNGSEFFGPMLGDIHTADLAFCESVIREQRQLAHERWLKATAELDEAKAEIERKDAAFQEIIDREDASWMPMRAFRSESEVELDDARHEAWVEAADIARQALKGSYQ